MNINERIKQIRIEKGMSQEDLAKKLGYTGRSTISAIECGKAKISVDNIKKYADALGVNEQYLMGLNVVEDIPHQLQYEYFTTLWKRLNKIGMDKLQEFAELLVSNEKYLK